MISIIIYKHQHAVNIASPGAFSVITNTDTTATATAAAATTAATIAATTTTITTAATKTKTKKKRKRNTRRTVSQLTNHECEAQKAKKKEEESYFEVVEQWKTQTLLPKKQQISCRNIVNDINKRNDTNVNESSRQ